MDILTGIYKEFKWLVWGLFGLMCLWFFTGGTNDYTARQGLYIKPPAPLNTGEAYGGAYISPLKEAKTDTIDLPPSPGEIIQNIENSFQNFLSKSSDENKQTYTSSLLSKTLYLDGIAGAKADTATEEYVRIIADKNAALLTTVSNLTLRSGSSGKSFAIPFADNMPILGTPAMQKHIALPPGGRLIITSGRSPIGTSFRVNICSGYIGQFQTIIPELKRECPDPIDELKKYGPYEETSCRTFVSKIPKCQTYDSTVPQTLSTSCETFIHNRLNYNGCALTHKDEKDFYKDEWRAFLNQTTELWKNKQEIIRLLDGNGNTIDAITY